MTVYLRAQAEDMKRVICSKTFFFCILSYIALSVITIAQEISYFHSETSIMYMRMMRDYLGVQTLYLLFAAVPSASGFCVDFQNRFYRYVVLKSSKGIYAASKTITCFFSSMIFVNLSEWLMIVSLIACGFPLTDQNFTDNLGVYNMFSSPEKIFVYLFITIFIKSLTASLFSLMALWVSTKIINIFVVLATPLLSYEILNTVFSMLGVPYMFQISEISKGRVNIQNNPALSFLCSVIVLVALALLFSIFFYRNCKRRIVND